MKKIIYTALSVFILVGIFTDYVFSQEIPDGPYFGQKPPGLTPVVFAPGIISINGRGEERITFSPQGNEIFFGIHSIDYQNHRIMRVVKKGKHWSKPDTVMFLGQGSVGSPIFAPNGDKLFFKSWKSNLSFIERNNNSWSTPIQLEKIIKLDEKSALPSCTSDGTLYFNIHSGLDDYASHKNNRIFFSRLKNNKYMKPQPLPDNINNESFAVYDPIIAPDESYMIFAANYLKGFGLGDLFISFRRDDGSWSNPKNLGDNINSENWDYAPSISPDGKYLFFTRWGPTSQPDIYWVEFDNMVIENLKIGKSN